LLFTIYVFSFITALIGPGLFALTMLQVVPPFTLITGPIDMLIYSLAIGLIIVPYTFIQVTIDMNKLSLAPRTVLLPSANIASPIWPSLSSKSLTPFALPLTFVDGPRPESKGAFLSDGKPGIIGLALTSLHRLVLCEVLRRLSTHHTAIPVVVHVFAGKVSFSLSLDLYNVLLVLLVVLVFLILTKSKRTLITNEGIESGLKA
jgi:hypothetical protein